MGVLSCKLVDNISWRLALLTALPSGAGTFRSNRNDLACIPCSLGSFSSSTGATECTLADYGSYTSTSASTSTVECPVGEYRASIDCEPWLIKHWHMIEFLQFHNQFSRWNVQCFSPLDCGSPSNSHASIICYVYLVGRTSDVGNALVKILSLALSLWRLFVL